MHVLIIIIAFIFGYYLGRRPVAQNTGDGSQNSLRDFNIKRQEEKDVHITKVLKFMATRDTTSNDDIEKLLDISDATATRYFDELQARGKVTSEGIGPNTKYRLTRV